MDRDRGQPGSASSIAFSVEPPDSPIGIFTPSVLIP